MQYHDKIETLQERFTKTLSPTLNPSKIPFPAFKIPPKVPTSHIFPPPRFPLPHSEKSN